MINNNSNDRDIVSLGRAIQEAEDGKTIIREDKISLIKNDYECLRGIISGEKAEITMDLHEPFKSVGSISIEGKTIVINDTEAFARIADRVRNIDVYPRTTGSIVIDFTYHGIME